MTWQPIETAPKDGTLILTAGLGHGTRSIGYDINDKPFPMQAVACWAWHDGTRDVEVEPGLFRKEPCRELEGWRTEFGYRPTHWMPLPSYPPALANAERPA